MSATAMVLTASLVAAAMGGELRSGSADQVIDGFAIDSRVLAARDLFFAIPAARDGHDFVADAVARGAVGVVVSRPIDVPIVSGAAPVVIVVADTVVALQDLGRHVRRASGARVIAITGSAGKTTTKETIAALLATRFAVTKNKGNLNNHLGLPLSLLDLRHGADVAVVELGMNHAGEIRVLVRIAEPDVRVWTNVGDAHLGHFASRAAIADAKGEILEAARPGDLLVANADDAMVMARAARFTGRVVTFGTTRAATVRAVALEDAGLAGTRFRLESPRGGADVVVPLLGRGNVSNVLAASAVALEFGVPLADVVATCATLRPAPHRGAVLRLGGGVTVVDDSYNSSPAALLRALDVIRADRTATRKAAVLGEMLELGAHAAALHESCGRSAAAAGLDRLIVVGGDAAGRLADAARARGMHAEAVTHVATSSDAAALILPWLRAGDLVLIKGSRGIRTDHVVDRIVAERS